MGANGVPDTAFQIKRPKKSVSGAASQILRPSSALVAFARNALQLLLQERRNA